MKNRIFLFFGWTLCQLFQAQAQEMYVPLNREMQQRYEFFLQSRSSDFHTSVKPWLSSDIARVANFDSLSAGPVRDTRFSRTLVGRKLLKEHLLRARGDDFVLYADPLFEFHGGRDLENDRTVFINSRGAWVSGSIGERFSFSTNFMESQARFPLYVDSMVRRSRVVPGGARTKILYTNFDYNIASGTISYSLKKHFNFQFGIDKNFIGDGYRSMILSDNAFNYPFLKINTTIWKIRYTNLYTVFQDLDTNRASRDQSFKKKYGSFHYLDIDIGKRFNLGFFEGIIWGGDSLRSSGYDLNYLNPLIFFRPVEFSLGSSDNAFMALTGKFKINSRNFIYGQFLLDEFNLNRVKAGKGWWANKQAFQLGFKCFNLFTVKRLYVTGEFNYARPYTYQHRSTLTNYAHYNQPLAHPLGANFYEILGIADYSYARFSLMAKVIYAEVGYDPRDSAGNYINMGQHVALDYLTHPNENGNWVGQGIRTNQLFTEIQLAYLVNPAYNLRIEAGAISRQTSNFMGKNNTLLLYAGLRTTLSNRYFDF